jgi:putative FmdB family regulatory protein
VPKYDFRCSLCGTLFELTRSFSQSADPASCPHDGAAATRLFSPPMDLLMYRREPVVDTHPVTIPPGALSCHDHGPPPVHVGAEDGRHTGSRWHAHGYESADGDHVAEGGGHQRGHGHSHAHGHGHGHPHGH